MSFRLTLFKGIRGSSTHYFIHFILSVFLTYVNLNMELKFSETNRGKSCLILDGHTYRESHVLKKGDVVYRCSSVKSCKASITFDSEGTTILKNNCNHSHNSDERKVEAQQLRVRCRKQSGDILSRPSKIVRTELQTLNESNLEPKDLKNVALALYKEEKNQPKVPKSRDDAHDIVSLMCIKTSKDESFIIENNKDTGIIIFTCNTKLECLSNDIKERILYVDGTFKCCPKYFYQLYTINGCKNGNYVPFIFVLLPSKSGESYMTMWNFILHHCQETNLILQPEKIHVDFEQSMLNTLRDVFPSARIMACSTIQSLGLRSEYKDKTCDTAKWLSQFFGICFLPPEKIEDCFVEDIMASAPKDNRCEKFADYVLENYVTSDSLYSPNIWAAAQQQEMQK